MAIEKRQSGGKIRKRNHNQTLKRYKIYIQELIHGLHHKNQLGPLLPPFPYSQ